MLTKTLLFVMVAVVALCQTPVAPDEAKGSISGVVRDTGTGSPMPEISVSVSVNVQYVSGGVIQSPNTRDITVVTDDRGEYRLSNVPTGRYHVEARSRQNHFVSASKWVSLAAGQDLTGIDFSIPALGTITGKVLDDNREPVPNVSVFLLSKEYYANGADYFPKDVTFTNDRGQYTLSRGVQAGHPYYLMAIRREGPLAAISDAPVNPKLRRPASTPTYYPGSTAVAGAQPVELRPGERRENIDIEVVRTPAYCIDGTLQSLGRPARMNFSVTDLRARYRASSSGGLYGALPGGLAGPDNKFRICNLAPGQYRISAIEAQYSQQDGPAVYGEAVFNIVKDDLHGVVVPAYPGVSVPVQVVWDGLPPAQPVTSQLSLSLRALANSGFSGAGDGGRTTIPGEFTVNNVLIQGYLPRPFFNAPDVYLKDIRYADRSVMNQPWQPGTAIGDAALKVILDHDGGTIQVSVTGRDGKPVFDASIVVMPFEVPSEAALQAVMVYGQTDQNGQYTSDTLAPGKYRVVATTSPIGPATDKIDKLWAARVRGKEVDLGPGGSQKIAVETIALE